MYCLDPSGWCIIYIDIYLCNILILVVGYYLDIYISMFYLDPSGWCIIWIDIYLCIILILVVGVLSG